MNIVKQALHLKMHINIGALLGLSVWLVLRGAPL